jgi:hypothetical protein
LKPLFHALDTIANSLISIKNIKTGKPDFHYEIKDRIDKESADFVAEFSSVRHAEEINTFIENPWVLEGKKEENICFQVLQRSFGSFG